MDKQKRTCGERVSEIMTLVQLVLRLKDRKLSLYDNGAGNEEMCRGSRGAYKRFGAGLRQTMTTGASSCRCLIKCKL